MSVGSTIPSQPISTDFGICSQMYGERLTLRQCQRAANLLPTSTQNQEYIPNARGSYGLPWQAQRGNCRIIVEFAGPHAVSSRTLITRPSDIRNLAYWIIEACVGGEGRGGFGTHGFTALSNYLTGLDVNFSSFMTWSPATSFITVTVDGGGLRPSPGDDSSYVPLRILGMLAKKQKEGGPHESYYTAAMTKINNRVIDTENGYKPWWGDETGTHNGPQDSASQDGDNMDFDCDANLGIPTAADCSQLDYSQLGPLSDIVSIGPGTPKLLSLNNCNLEVTSSIPLGVTWAQIRWALETLINVCVMNPLTSPVGGRAYYRGQTLANRDLGNRNSDSALNFLPPHMNVTVSQPGHFAL